MALMKIGTKIPPPVQARIILMNLNDKGESLPKFPKTLEPACSHRGGKEYKLRVK